MQQHLGPHSRWLWNLWSTWGEFPAQIKQWFVKICVYKEEYPIFWINRSYTVYTHTNCKMECNVSSIVHKLPYRFSLHWHFKLPKQGSLCKALNILYFCCYSGCKPSKWVIQRLHRKSYWNNPKITLLSSC